MSPREFLTDEIWIAWKADMDALLTFRKTLRGIPDQYQRAQMALNKPWIEFYRTVLFHTGANTCPCRRCTLNREGEQSCATS